MISTKNTQPLKAKPFLKWAGSKKWLIPSIKKYIPQEFNDYYEPFLGSGAMFFALSSKKAMLSDINSNLIDTYSALKNDVEAVIEELKKMPYEKDFYYYIRDNYKPWSLTGKAKKLIYLNRTCWNGLYRENREGKFNVPFGKHTNPTICDENNLREVASLLKKVDLNAHSFDKAVCNAKRGDFIFIDPPYITGHKNNGFHGYNEKLFKWIDQEKLAEVAAELDAKGCFVLITNAEHSSIKELYQKYNLFDIHTELRFSNIAADITKRKEITELIITNIKNK